LPKQFVLLPEGGYTFKCLVFCGPDLDEWDTGKPCINPYIPFDFTAWSPTTTFSLDQYEILQYFLDRCTANTSTAVFDSVSEKWTPCSQNARLLLSDRKDNVVVVWIGEGFLEDGRPGFPNLYIGPIKRFCTYNSRRDFLSSLPVDPYPDSFYDRLPTHLKKWGMSIFTMFSN
ncbi:hypothetical protein BDQ17DRAFT_1338358, partial [Cyathus striatus]